MKPGRLDKLITIQRRVSTLSSSGEDIASWVNVAARCPATVTPVRGSETDGRPQPVAQEQVNFMVRRTAALATISPLDRILYPAPQIGMEDLVGERTIYDVLAVHEIGRNEGLRFIAQRHSDRPAS